MTIKFTNLGGSSGSGGAVDSVNGKTGIVVLSPEDVGADPAGTGSEVIAQHEVAADPHPQYLTQSEGDAQYAPQTHSHTSSQISDFSEVVESIIGGSIVAGAGVSVDYNDSTGKTTISASGGGGSASEMIRTPVAVAPLTGTNEFPVDGTLQASPYAPLYSADTREFREFQIDTATGDFTNPVAAAQVNADTWAISPAIPDNTDLKWRCRDKSVKGDYSEWSESQTFKTYDVYVVTPVILSPIEGGELFAAKQPITTSAFQMVNSGDTHVASYWTIKDSLGAVVYQTGRDTVNLTSWQPPAGVIVDGESMAVEVVYESSGGYVSEAGVRGFVGVGVGYGKYLTVAHYNNPFATAYGVDVDSFIELPSFTKPPGNGLSAAFTQDGEYLAIGHEVSPYLSIYRWAGDALTKLSGPSSPPTSTGRGVSFTPDGIYLAIAHDATPFLTVYKRNGDVFTKLSNPSVLPPTLCTGVSFSPDGEHLVVGSTASPFVVIYRRSGDSFTKLANPTSLPEGGVFGVAFSQDGAFLALSLTVSPFIAIYSISGDSYTRLPNPPSLPSGAGRGICFSPDGSKLLVGHQNSPFISIYSRSGNVFTKISSPSVLPAGDGNFLAFSQDGTQMAVAHANTPFLTLYSVSGDVFTKLPNPSTIPAGIGRGVAFWPSALYPST